MIQGAYNLNSPVNGGTIGDKLRRAAAKAVQAAALPAMLPQLWAGTTDYSVNFTLGHTVRTTANKLYQLVVAGTSSSTEPSGADEKLVYTDGTCKWRYAGLLNPQTAALDAPALTDYSGNPAGLTNFIDGTTDPLLQYLRFDSANYVIKHSSFNQTKSVNASLGLNKTGNVTTGDGTYQGLSALQNRVSIITDAPVVSFQWANGNAVARVYVDGVPLWPGGRLSGSGTSGNNGLTLDWSASSSRKVRRITLEMGGNKPLVKVFYADYSRLYKWEGESALKVAFLGDSYIAGGDNMPLDPGRSWTNLAADLLGWPSVNPSGLGGTGVSTAGSYQKYIDRAPMDLFGIGRVVPSSPSAYVELGSGFVPPDVVVIQGSVNDVTQATLDADSLALYNYIRTVFAGPVIWTGMVQTAAMGAGQAATAEALMFSLLPADPLLFKIPVSTTDALNPQAWFVGTGHSGIGASGSASITGSVGDTNPAYVCSDATHLNPHGIAYYASRFAQSVRQRVLPNLP